MFHIYMKKYSFAFPCLRKKSLVGTQKEVSFTASSIQDKNYRTRVLLNTITSVITLSYAVSNTLIYSGGIDFLSIFKLSATQLNYQFFHLKERPSS